ncbi:MAG: beta-ketoacyl-ACP synthase II [Candidatus Krumholzibacteriota bacterium]|nr:beta-ketoacyl-ACP synthase II [Candidatus Krumholzibacteriota bacterium]
MDSTGGNMSASSRRVVVTGMGVISPCGKTVEENWENIVAGRTGIDIIKAFDVSDYSSQVGGEVKDFDPNEYIERKDAKRMDRSSQLAVAASAETVSHLDVDKADGDNFGVIIGSGIGGIKTFEKQHERYMKGGPSRISPFFIPMMISDMASGLVSIRYGFKGPNYATVSACASGGHAIATSWMAIKSGYCDAVVTGGTEATISPMALGGFCQMKALSTRNDDPKTSSRPFDLDRDGFVMAEGAGIILLEELEHAKARGAEIFAELAGVGMTADAYHITAPSPDGEGALSSMCMALKDAGITPEDIGYINAHGTSTQYNDRAEAQAILSLFGRDSSVDVSSTKSCTGHLLGGAAGVEFIISTMALVNNVMPPTANLENIDEDCRLNHLLKAREKKLNYVLSNSFGFGGHNVSLVLKKF